MTTAPNANMIWGAAAIAAYLGKSERATYHLLEKKQIPGAVKIGNQHTLNVDLFLKKIAEQAA